MSFFYILISISSGYLLVRYFFPRRGGGESLLYGSAAGTALISFFMFCASMLTGSFFTGYIIILLLAGFGMFFAVRDSVSRVRGQKISVFTIEEILFFSAVTFLLEWQLFMSLPFTVWDAWSSYGLKGKMFFTEQRIPLEYFKNWQFLTFLRLPFYPLNLSLNEGFFATLLGSFDEAKLKLISLEFGLMSSALIYLTLKKSLSAMGSFFLCFIFIFTPMIIFHSAGFFAGCTDIIFMFYNVAAAVLLYEFSCNKDKRLFFLSSFFAAFSLWTKFEGFICTISIILSAFVLFENKKEWLRLSAIYLIMPFALNLPWWAVKFLTHMEFSYSLVRPHLFAHLGDKVFLLTGVLGKEFVSFWKWGWVWVIMPVAVLINAGKREKRMEFFLITLLLEITGYVMVFSFLSSPEFLKERIKSGPPLSIERGLLCVFPFAILVIGGVLTDIFPNKRGVK